MSESRAAYADLLATLAEVGDRFAGRGVGPSTDPGDVAEGLRVVLHHLATGIETQLDDDPARPRLPAHRRRPGARRWATTPTPATTTRRSTRPAPTGYGAAPAGAVYVSFTVEAGAEDGSFPTGTLGVLNDTGFDVGRRRRRSRSRVGGPPRDRRRGCRWRPDASRMTVRHYWEGRAHPLAPARGRPGPRHRAGRRARRRARRAARADRRDRRGRDPADGDLRPEPHARPDPQARRGRAAGLRVARAPRVPRPRAARRPRAWRPPTPPTAWRPTCSAPTTPWSCAARWPECRCANVSLWNRQIQTFDYLRDPVSLNRAQTVPDPTARSDGDRPPRPWRARLAITEGRPFGLVFWRFMLPEGPIETPVAEVVPVDSLARRQP